MKYRDLGNTGIRVSEVAFGGSALGGAFGPPDEETGIRAVHTALDLGINLFDVSPLYGDTLAETVLGKALKGIPRDRFLVSTKAGRYHPSTYDFSPERLARSLDESLNRLGLEYVDVFLCHDIEFVPLPPIIEESLPAMRRLRDAGKARAIGVSGYPLRIFREILSRAEVDVALSYCHYTLYDQSLRSLSPMVRDRGSGLINAAPLGMALLSGSDPPPWHPASSELKSACRRAAGLCRERGSNIAVLGLQYALDSSPADTTLIGMAAPEEVRRNVGSAESAIDRALLSDVLRIFEGVEETVWPSGLPQNN